MPQTFQNFTGKSTAVQYRYQVSADIIGHILDNQEGMHGNIVSSSRKGKPHCSKRFKSLGYSVKLTQLESQN